jgi:hypothetical protein
MSLFHLHSDLYGTSSPFSSAILGLGSMVNMIDEVHERHHINLNKLPLRIYTTQDMSDLSCMIVNNVKKKARK